MIFSQNRGKGKKLKKDKLPTIEPIVYAFIGKRPHKTVSCLF